VPSTVRVVFLGNDAWSVPTLEALARDELAEVALVVTNPARPAGRGSKLRPTQVATAAEQLGLPLAETESTRNEGFLDRLHAIVPDATVVVAYGELLSPDVLRIARLGSMNLHFSLLPRWRGASPVQHAILAGDAVTGVTVMLMDEGLDTGPVLARAAVPIRSDDDAGSLGARLATVGAELTIDVIHRFALDEVVIPSPQGGSSSPASAPSFAPKLQPADRVVDWLQPAQVIVRRIRAFAPDPGATTTWRGEDFKLLHAEEAESHAGDPGTVVEADRNTVTIATGSGAVRLLAVAPAGRRRMSGGDWARGVRDVVGERLG
jgi:methionyl-tRNA formyltransferase